MFKVDKIWFIISTATFEVDLVLNDILVRSPINSEDAKKIITWMKDKTTTQNDGHSIGYLFSE